ncbi:melanoma-associated antigen B16-like [Perognathus longimembris pacificus]|uniref:melanoma-associated antigen B16-like n=1 Tax=Perognathus longimembris pacificus TaxID=214514 RepID=UPI0020184831|nr:melanoma-associated antigen B16-like [Perognathus longimembris pacificus]
MYFAALQQVVCGQVARGLAYSSHKGTISSLATPLLCAPVGFQEGEKSTFSSLLPTTWDTESEEIGGEGIKNLRPLRKGIQWNSVVNKQECPESIELRDNSDGPSGEVVRETNEEYEGCSYQEREDLYLCDDELAHMALRKEAIALVPYLLYKYWSRETVSDADMFSLIKRGHECYFPQILDKASNFMQLLFGIDMKEADPVLHTHILFIAAGITYDGVQSDVQGIPKTGLLIIVLCIVFMQGNCATEEAIWSVLNKMEVYSDKEHFLYGNPRKLVTEDFVSEQYLEYQEVPGSDPTICEFRWGPRAFAETTKMKLLEHWAKFSGVDPMDFPLLYEEALREEQEANTHDITTAIEE